MSRTLFKKLAERPTWRARLVGGLLALVLVPALASAQSAQDKYQMKQDRNSRFNLASSPTTVLQVNQYQCGLVNTGDTCTDVFDSPTGGGGFWPTGSPNQYMFNSGLQIAGIIPIAADCTPAMKATESRPDCFAWAGDTTGAFFFDASGVRQHGTALTDIYDSLNPEDLANWPGTPGLAPVHPEFPTASAYVSDTTLFNDVLIGRQAASQQDSWVMYWDGDPTKTGGRTHPMGILVEQRSLAWNYPTGNENVIYFIYKFTNVTSNPLFQRLSETRYAIQLPNEGWKFDSIYVAFAADPDVTPDATLNYSTAILPFNLGLSYKDNFVAPDFVYPPDLFHPPFFESAPGLVAMQYLKSPIDPATGEEVGLTSFSLTTNGGAFSDPSTVQRGWRYISLNVDAGKGDPNCTFAPAEVRERKSCYLAQTPADVRMFVGSGPFSLEPGASATIAVAQYAAATVNATGSVVPGTDNKPGFPDPTPGCGGQSIRPIEVASGYIGVPACPTEEGATLGIFDVDVVPNSLLGRAQVAQSIFSNKFLLGFAPEAPPFYLVPGDNRMTIVWEPSATEQAGDPFFSAAGDEENPLFDPNYRQFDVEGYRIYRGTTPANLRLIAQFDKSGSTFTDNLCMMDETHISADPCTEVHEYDISSPFVQYVTVAELANGDPIVLDADTALSAQIAAGTGRELSNTGVPFAYVDTDVRNGFQYFYRVTAFDINSVRSGPTSLESAAASKSAVPAAGSPNLTLASFNTYVAGMDGEPLDTEQPLPTIDPQTGIFSGPMPPTNAVEGTFAPVVERLLPELNLTIRIDSVKMGFTAADCPAGQATTIPSCWTMYLTADRDGQQIQYEEHGFTPTWGAFGGANLTEYVLAQTRVEADPTAAEQYNIPAGGAGFNAAIVAQFPETIAMSGHLGQALSRNGNTSGNSLASPIVSGVNGVPGGSRWFVGENESEPDPTRLLRHGHIPGIDTIFSPALAPGLAAERVNMGFPGLIYNNACFGYNLGPVMRAADVEFRWGAAGAEVVDVTHNVAVPFKPSTQASYGFLVTDANANGVIDYDDFNNVEGVRDATTTCSRAANTSEVQLVQTPSLVPVSVATATNAAGIAAMTPTGQGFGLYLNGERYIVQTSSLPTSGTWTHRSYQGFVTASTAPLSQDPSGYAFSDRGLIRPPMIPGLTVVFEVEQPSVLTADVDLTRVHTVPDPYYVASIFDLSATAKELQFVNLPARATIRIYSLSGVLVDVVNHTDEAGGGRTTWDLRNRSNQFVASGVYVYHVSTPDGKSHIGKFTVVNSGIAR